MTDPTPDQQPVIETAPTGGMTQPPSQPTDTNIEDVKSGQAASEIPQALGVEAGAQYQLHLEDTFLGSPMEGIAGTEARRLREAYADFQDRNHPKTPAQDLNNQYKSLIDQKVLDPFTEDTHPRVAQMRATQAMHTLNLQKWASGDNAATAPLTGPQNLGVGLISGLADPVNIALGTGIGVASAGLGFAPSVLNTLSQGLIFGGLTEGNKYLSKKAGQEPTEFDWEGVAENAAGMAAFHALMYGFKSSAKAFNETPPEQRAQNMKAITYQDSVGAKPDISQGELVTQQKQLGRPVPQAGEQKLLPYYGAVDSEGTPLALTRNHPVEGGIELSQDQSKANAVATNTETGKHGSVGEFHLPEEQKFLDMSQGVGTPEAQKFLQEMTKGEFKRETDVSSRVYYHGTKAVGLTSLQEAEPTSHSKVGNLYGDGLYMTDNPRVAQGYAGEKGSVLAAQLSGLNLVDLEKPLPSAAMKVFKDALPRDSDANLTKLKHAPGKDVFRAVMQAHEDNGSTHSDMSDVYQHITSGLWEEGFHGLSHQGGGLVGKTPHNVAIVYDSPYGGMEKHSLWDVNTLGQALSAYDHGSTIGNYPADILAKAQEIAKKQGFSGYRFPGEAGEADHIHVFDPAEPHAVHPVDAIDSPSMTTDQRSQGLKDSTALETKSYYDPATEKEIHDFRHGSPPGTDLESITKANEVSMEKAKREIDALGEENPEWAEKAKEQMARDLATDKQETKCMSILNDCWGLT